MGKNKMKLIIGNRIKVLRKKDSLSQEQLANEVFVTRATINSIEKGHYNPSLELAFRISEYFQENINDVFSVEGEYE